MSAQFDTAGSGRFRVTGPMTFDTVPQLLRQSENRFSQGERVEIDLAEVGDSDSAGLALLIEWKRLGRQKNCAVNFVNTPPQLSAVARISEVDELLGESSTEHEEERATV